MIVITKNISFSVQARRKRIVEAGAKPSPPRPTTRPARIPRIARLMALAIKFKGLLQDGTVADQSDLAFFAHVTQPRMTQILNLNHLAPDIQEELLFMTIDRGREAIHERALRPICKEYSWRRQRKEWRRLTNAYPEGCLQRDDAPITEK